MVVLEQDATLPLCAQKLGGPQGRGGLRAFLLPERSCLGEGADGFTGRAGPPHLTMVAHGVPNLPGPLPVTP